MVWIKVDSDVPRHPKVVNMSLLINRNVSETLGLILRFWCWGLEFAPDGKFVPGTCFAIEQIIGWNGDKGVFIDALIQCKLVDQTDDELVIHDFYERTQGLYQAKEAKRKRELRRKNQDRKSKEKQPKNVPGTSRGHTRDSTVKSRAEKEKEKENIYRSDLNERSDLYKDRSTKNENGQTQAPDGASSADASPASPTKELNNHLAEARKVQEHYLSKFPRRGTQARCKKNTRHIINRLKEGYTADSLISAIDGCLGSEFHREGGYNKLELVVRSSEQVDQFIDKHRQQGSWLTGDWVDPFEEKPGERVEQ